MANSARIRRLFIFNALIVMSRTQGP